METNTPLGAKVKLALLNEVVGKAHLEPGDTLILATKTTCTDPAKAAF